jgi:esterase/lipase
MDWTTIITALIAAIIPTGGLVAIVTLVEKKSALMLENAKQLADSYKQLAEEYQQREAETQQLLRSKEQELLAQIKMNSGLRHSLDDAHTECAVAKLMYCKNSKCVDRDPPFGKDANLVVKEMEGKTQKRYNQRTDGDNQ